MGSCFLFYSPAPFSDFGTWHHDLPFCVSPCSFFTFANRHLNASTPATRKKTTNPLHCRCVCKLLAGWVFILFIVFTAGGGARRGGGQEIVSPSLVILNIKKQNQESKFAKLVVTLGEMEGGGAQKSR